MSKHKRVNFLLDRAEKTMRRANKLKAHIADLELQLATLNIKSRDDIDAAKKLVRE